MPALMATAFPWVFSVERVDVADPMHRVCSDEMACLNKYGGGPWFESYQEEIGHGGSDRDIGNGVSGRCRALCAGDGGEAERVQRQRG